MTERSEPMSVRMASVCAELLDIMKTYHEQDKRGNIDTPGGLEHMGDVWSLFLKWERMLKGQNP